MFEPKVGTDSGSALLHRGEAHVAELLRTSGACVVDASPIIDHAHMHRRR
jgi:hypothetical protein